MFNFSNYSDYSKYYDDSNKLVFGKMKGETAAIAIKDILPLKPKTYSFSVDDSREDKKQRMWIKVLLQQ